MAGYWLFGILAALGLLSVLWALFGFLLPAGQGSAVVYFGEPKIEDLAVFKWLKSLGILRCPLIAITEAHCHHLEDIEICSPEALIPRLMEERKRFDGTGDGDHTGRHQRRGISEL